MSECGDPAILRGLPRTESHCRHLEWLKELNEFGMLKILSHKETHVLDRHPKRSLHATNACGRMAFTIEPTALIQEFPVLQIHVFEFLAGT